MTPLSTSIPKLAKAVLAAVGKDYIEDLARHGAECGFPGITYYTDTVAFYKKHKRLIIQLAESLGILPSILARNATMNMCHVKNTS